MLNEDLKDRFESRSVPGIGSSKAGVYLLVDPPNFTNLKVNSPLSKEHYASLMDHFNSNGLYPSQEDFLAEVRVHPAIPYSLKYVEGGSPLKDSEINEFRDITLEDIDLTAPGVIIACGDVAIKVLTSNEFKTVKSALEFSSTAVYTYKGIPVVFSESLKSVFGAYKGEFLRKELNKFSGKFIRANNLKKGLITTESISDSDYTTLDAFDPSEVQTLFDLFLGHSKLVLDYEASGLNTYRDGFHLGGIGLCSIDQTVSVYVRFYDFERRHTGSNPVPKETLETLNSFFGIKDFVVFNKQYECAVTASPAVGINFNLKKSEDLLMWLRCLSASSSLKDACVARLGVQKWNDGVSEWVKCINEIVKSGKPTVTMKGQRKQIEFLRENPEIGLFEIEEFYRQEFDVEVFKELKRISTGKPKIILDISKLDSKNREVVRFCEDNKTRMKSAKTKGEVLQEFKALDLPRRLTYEGGKELFLKPTSLKFLALIQRFKKTCSRYFNSEELQELSSELKDYVYNLLVNHEVFEYASYADVSGRMMAPYCISDCIYTAQLYHNLKEEIQSKGLEKAAEVYDRHGYLGYVFSRNGIAWDDKLATTLFEQYSESKLEALRSLITIPSMTKILYLNASSLLNIRSTTDIQELKNVFNPDSSHKYKGEDSHKSTSERMSKLLGTPRFKVASLLYDAFEFYKSLEDEKETKKQFPTLWPLYKVCSEFKTASERTDYLAYILANSKEVLGDPMTKNQSLYMKYNKGESPQEVRERLKYKGWKLESMDYDATNRLYKIFEIIFGVNPDDDSEWPEEFKALYYFKLYKKVGKSLGTYINGKVGRDSVEVVKKDNLNQSAPLRECSYLYRPLSGDEVYLSSTDWSVCSANCLVSDTQILLTNGASVEISEISKDIKTRDYIIFSVDNEGNQISAEITDAFISGYVTETIKLTLENGKTIECTPDHRFLLTTGEYIEAKDITEEHDLWEVGTPGTLV